MSVSDVKFEESSPPPIEFSPEEQEAIRFKMKALDELLKDRKHAKYKIELFFGKARSMTKPTPGIMSFWESGSKLHGGGDAKIYFCPGKMRGINECSAVIPEAANVSSLHFCPTCRKSWQGKLVIGEVVANWTMRHWANALLYYYTRLDHNADIYLKHAREDIRTVAMIEQARQKGGEFLNRVRSRRALHIYPLNRIIKDTSAGADLSGRIYAFLTA